MNSGNIVTTNLNRLSLSVNDSAMRDLAYDMLNEVIQEHWSYKEWKFKRLTDSITTAASTAEYALNKRVGSLSDIIDNSFRGSDPERTIGFLPTQGFFYQHPYEAASGTPYKCYPGSVKGYSANPSSASAIAFASSFTNYTTGTVTVINGSNRVIFAGGASIPANYIGASFRISGDQVSYKLVKSDLASTTIFYLDKAYQGTTAAGASYTLGDVSQKATVVGYVSTSLVEEEVQLTGSTSASTVNQFTSLVKISKSDKTLGYITATSNAAAVTNIVLDPAETEISVFWINLYPTPTAVETINYEFMATHPILYKFSDAPLFPSQYHPLIQLDHYIKLLTEWLKQDAPQTVLERRQKLLNQMVDIDNNTDNWKKLQESERASTRLKVTNLPPEYGTEDDY